jgi:hypothetical protein
MQIRIENDSAILKPLIEQCFRNLNKSTYYDYRTDKPFIVNIAREFLKKRGIETQWPEQKVYEFALNAIEFINITLPRFRELRKQYGLSNDQICKALEIKNTVTLHNTFSKNAILRKFINTVELIASATA